jgi:hypothetical protein
MIEVKELQKNIDFCTISCTNNKSKKLKKKNTAVECLPTYYENVLRQYPVSLRNSKAKGRHAVASENLEGGTLLCKEQASAFVVRAEFLDQQCHICLTDLSTKMMCADCKKTFYCSKECMETDEEIHKLACSVFSQVDAIGKATDVDPDLLRLITLLMIRRYFDKSVNETSSDSTNNPTPYTCVEDLLSHKESANPAFIRVLTDACKFIPMLQLYTSFFCLFVH